MVNLPEEVMKAVNDPKSMKVIATKAPNGNVHAIRVGSMIAPTPNMMAIGAILMKETSKNLDEMRKKNETASLLVSAEMTSYQVKAKVKDYQTAGPLFDKMNEELKKMGLKARGVYVFEPVEVYNQSASYDAGKRMA
jgi:hypothetical protein